MATWLSAAKAMKDKRIVKLIKKPTQLKNLKKAAGIKAYVRRRPSLGAAGAVQIDIAAAKTAKFK